MATLDSLKQALRQTVMATLMSPTQALSDKQYSTGFDILMQGSGQKTYQDFIIPQLSYLLAPFFNSRVQVSVLEVGPGSKSVLDCLPSHLRRKIRKYTAFEPNSLFARELEEQLCSTSATGCSMPCLETPPSIHRLPFVQQDNIGINKSTSTRDVDERYDIVLFCHSMYGMKPKGRFIERALQMLVEQPQGGIVVVFHRDGVLHLDGLVCQQTASFPTGTVSVANDDEVLNSFSPFVAGFNIQNVDVDSAIRVEWRKICRALSRREESQGDHLIFSSPNVMAVFTQHATTLPELTAQVPLVTGDKTVKNREARLYNSVSIVRPTEVRHVQECIGWALRHGVSLAVMGGGHSGHSLWPNVVSVDMGAFDKIHIISVKGGEKESDPGSLVVVETGCKTGDIVRKTMAAGLIVPLGARPSVGAGLWLQGGIGHLARLHGLACDAIVGAVVVSVDCGQVYCVGLVPSQCIPDGAVRPAHEKDLLWAIKGAGTNFGIVISTTFRAFTAPSFSIRNWVVPLSNTVNMRLMLSKFDVSITSKLPRESSADLYLYYDNDQLCLGVTMYESSTLGPASDTPSQMLLGTLLGPAGTVKAADSIGLFDSEMYISGMHGGHGSGKTSSFKRCIFLKCIGADNVANILVAALETRPSPLSYLHLLQGGGAAAEVAVDSTAFGCRNWDFACIITGVWRRRDDGTELAQAVVRWVYQVAKSLLPLGSGAYGADLGPDPRDAALAIEAFGQNKQRLARLKRSLDPRNVLAYACPLLKAPMKQKLILLVTGEHCAGKDYCADVWVTVLIQRSLKARAVSISETTKQEYATATGADLNRLLRDRAYKEQHRLALTKFFHSQVQQRPQLLEEHFLKVVYSATDVDVLLITGMRDEAPVIAFSHLVPHNKLLEIRVQAREEMWQPHTECYGSDVDPDRREDNRVDAERSNVKALDHRPSLIFNNNTTGHQAARSFAEHYLLPFVHEDVQRLASMVRLVPDFPRPGIEFRHVLGISQQPGGLTLCTYLLQTHFGGNWAKVDAVACCEAGGIVYASALASCVDKTLLLIREAGKLPPPKVSVLKPSSYISSLATNKSKDKQFEIEVDVVPSGASVVVVDDVLSTGETLCVVLQLLGKAGIDAENISIIVVAEFPLHRGRELLRQCGYGGIPVQSLLVFGSA